MNDYIVTKLFHFTNFRLIFEMNYINIRNTPFSKNKILSENAVSKSDNSNLEISVFLEVTRSSRKFTKSSQTCIFFFFLLLSINKKYYKCCGIISKRECIQ